MADELHVLVRLTRDTVENYVRQGKLSVPQEGELALWAKERAGVFVSIHKQGKLRGCIGTFAPTTANVVEEVMRNAVNAAARDPRFQPVTSVELGDLEYSVDVLARPEQVADAGRLDASKYGVIVESGYRRGLLLPDLEGVDSVEQQLEICRLKAGISPDEPVTLYRFEVRRFK